MIQGKVFRAILRLIGILALEIIILFALLYFLSSEREIRELWELLRGQGFIARLGQACAACLLIGILAVIVGMPLGFGIADLRKGKRPVLLMILLFAVFPEALRLSIGALGIIAPKAFLLAFPAISWSMFLSVLGIGAFPRSILASAELCGASGYAVFTQILLPIMLPFCLACMLWSMLLLILLEGTLFSLVVFIFKQENMVFASFVMSLLALPLFTILIYLFVYIRHFRHAVSS